MEFFTDICRTITGKFVINKPPKRLRSSTPIFSRETSIDCLDLLSRSIRTVEISHAVPGIIRIIIRFGCVLVIRSIIWIILITIWRSCAEGCLSFCCECLKFLIIKTMISWNSQSSFCFTCESGTNSGSTFRLNLISYEPLNWFNRSTPTVWQIMTDHFHLISRRQIARSSSQAVPIVTFAET